MYSFLERMLAALSECRSPQRVRARAGLRAPQERKQPGVTEPALATVTLQVQEISDAFFLFISLNKAIYI